MGRHQHLTGTWRARGLDGLDPGMAHTLTIVQKGSRFVGSDSASRGITRGAVLSACHGGRLRAVGAYRREDGTAGRLAWSLSHDGGRLDGVVQDAGRASRPFVAIRQSVTVPGGQAGFMDRRVWDGGEGLAGVKVRWCEAKVGGIVVGRVPCGGDVEGPGGSSVRIGKEGVKVREPSIEDLIGGGGKDGGKAAPPAADPGGTEAAKASAGTMRALLWAAGAALVVGAAALVIRSRRSA